MKKHICLTSIALTLVIIGFYSCKKEENSKAMLETPSATAVQSAFLGAINIDKLEQYAGQEIPDYITKDNSGGNYVTDKGATLGRVLFYDKKLSTLNIVSCATCHIQQYAFGDTARASLGVNGSTGRHSMRLVNARFGSETKFFWDERASSLEDQTTKPIQDHNEMGFSGQNGDPGINDLIVKLSKVSYYKELFKFVYGSEEITENKIQLALAQFIRSVQAFDSKYDEGRKQVNSNLADFPNFSSEENFGKYLFMTPAIFDATSKRVGGGLGCNNCHRAPEFDIDPDCNSNGVSNRIAGGTDYTNTRAPSLRNVYDLKGNLNGPLMHNGSFYTIQSVLEHYNNLTDASANNPNLDIRLKPNGTNGQQLQLKPEEITAIVAFIKTLSGNSVYSNLKWSNPFPNRN
ncbi:MAG: cytochrome-c peroxidase [Bacteroidia bacterium]|nr:cytochrome-c peroxidase [Bacteroidia bacterium]